MYFDLTEYTDALLRSTHLETSKKVYLYTEYYHSFQPDLKDNDFAFLLYKLLKLPTELKFKIPSQIDFSFGYDEFIRLAIFNPDIVILSTLNQNELDFWVKSEYSVHHDGLLSQMLPGFIHNFMKTNIFYMIELYVDIFDPNQTINDIHEKLNKSMLNDFGNHMIVQKLDMLSFPARFKQIKMNEDIFKG